ncbi:T9SS type A sorting domain-containing protein [Tamlana sp. 2_MG-2023]|uniref:ELWxxDGT repeat protein n=1 Tax=unclassified Tamlana TaxID=2614803 RepID=UPI0026E2EF1F|nr:MULTISPECIES: ELWxxDGT repeat protein [unclassified Tamlana]MDO6761820.1 T9SS type A sorting domain-containing protein [Tamlana sp. 2_MG-2023]MDO6792583.1 T9SS type A sorting domain-containing protein [Tamlana sp. 1_MG-2023]
MKNTILSICLLFSVQIIFGQEIITDFFNKTGDKSSIPSGFVEFNQKLFFAASTETTGREMWVSNGNPNEAHILKDINPGSEIGIEGYFSDTAVVINNTLYFVANDNSSNGEIWKTDGTTKGTEKVTNFLNSKISKLTLIDNRFYFLIQKDDVLQIWLSDGTKVGTRIVKDNLPIWNSPTFQGKCNSTFIFTFQQEGTNDSRVWRSDGTEEGTYPITEGLDGNGGNYALSQYIEFNNELYFVSRNYLHKTDGTAENTVEITTLHAASTRLIDYADAVVANGKLYFSFFEADFGRLFIWETDGSSIGSKIIFDNEENGFFAPSNLLGVNNSLVFFGPNETGSTSLLRINLSDYSVNELIGIQDDPNNQAFFVPFLTQSYIQSINEDKIFCSAYIYGSDRLGLISGLTESTTNSNAALDNVKNIYNFQNSIYFAGTSDLEGTELWKSDTNHENFQLLDNINKSRYGLPARNNLVAINSNLIFKANDGITGDELWSYNGTEVLLLKDIKTGSETSFPSSFTSYKNNIYFSARDQTQGFTLWKTNGTAAKTEIVDGENTSGASVLTVYKDLLFFTIYDGRYHLCKSNGSNIEAIKELGTNIYGNPTFINETKVSGDYLYFVNTNTELWKTDGTETGTTLLKTASSCRNLTDVNGKIFFTATEEHSTAYQLWQTDGMETNTKLVKDHDPEHFAEIKDLIPFKGSLFFTAISNENGKELWKSDGTENGTIQVSDINPGSENAISNPNFCVLNDALYFSATDGKNGFELWKTDGTEAGTKLVKDINIGSGGSFPSELVVINDLIYFQAYDTAHGFELWKTDGTEAGTILAADIYPGIISSAPINITSIDNDIFFIAETSNKGQQIWKLQYDTLNTKPELLGGLDTTNVYPNPFINHIHFNTNANVGAISIYNSNGQLVSTQKATNNSLNLSQFPSGLYIIKFNIDGKTIHKKIIKK